MKSSVFTQIFLALALALTLAFSVAAPELLAQSADVSVEGLDTVGTAAGLSAQDPTIIVAKIIRGGLGILGMIAMIILIYGGFLWMTAGGNEDRVTRAKRLIINAGVGLFIILASFGITQLVLEALINATSDDAGGSSFDDVADGGLGGGSASVFSITLHKPAGQVLIRNVVPQITFSKTLDASTVTSENIKFIYDNGGVEIPGELTVSGSRVSFVPATPCPDPDSDRGCFDENALVNVTVNTDVKSSMGTVLSCANSLCASAFTTGTLIDTEDPVAHMELPDDGAGVPSESLVDVQVSATDDAQVSVADFAVSDLIFDSVPASGEDLTNVLINSVWDTAGLLNGSSYKLTATVIDIAGNADEDSITVEMRPPTCFNGVTDGLETGPDCGGDSASPDYCGACDGSSCNANDECSSGMCEGGICTSLPVIESITPPDGAPGTWVTIQGENFGSLAGTVLFTSAAGTITAELASCTDAWSNTQIIVVVPEGAVDGPITVTTATGGVESTFDDNGLLIADFDVNDVNHPGLCDIDPSVGAINDAVTITGVSFGDERGSSIITFDTLEAGSYNSWSATAAEVTVPSMSDGQYGVAISVDSIVSNAIAFTVTSQVAAVPFISSLTPSSGGEGQYITLSGTNFGSGVGTVWFEDQASGERVLADTDSFPAACADDFWSYQEVIVIVPKGLGELGSYNLILVANGNESNPSTFTLTDESPTPGLCAIDPAQAVAGDAVTLYGDNFGDSQGSVTFTPAVIGDIQSWSEAEISVVVPDGAMTGAVLASNSAGTASNSTNLEVSADGVVSAAGELAAYAWSFSSGLIPTAPEIVFECSDTAVSGVPNDDFDNGPGVCVNAAVFVDFTLPMNEATLNNLVLEECLGSGNNPCDQTSPVAGEYLTTSTNVLFYPATSLKISTVYQVTAFESILSSEGVPLANPSVWTFTTRADASLCQLENVVITPDAATIRELNGTQAFTAVPINGCTVLQNPDFHWSWSVDPSYARVVDIPSEDGYDATCTAGDSLCAFIGALAEGETEVIVTETDSGLQAQAALTVNFSDPYITNSWPTCTEACVNAEVGASFNTAMEKNSLEAAGAIQLYVCDNELCSNLQSVAGTTVTCTYDADASCTGFAFNSVDLIPLKFYRVIVDGAITSTSGVALTRTNYAGDYSWTFRVREDASVCAIDRLTLSPSEVTVATVGAQQTFTGEAYGEADSCSVSGQRLNGFNYNWGWTDPIADEDVDNNPATRVAVWEVGLVDTNLSDISAGCSASCTAAGSWPQTAICGDGVIDYSEECEDGNVANGDGCSASCLREASEAPGCGDNLVNRAPDGTGEDCDDGNLLDGDGCSAGCLSEGAAAIGVSCGNSDVAVTSPTALAGEECDDGNAARGDGCSNECLWEGSPTLSEIGGAVCNDGSIELPTEECEDGNVTDGDGCSASCLWEGSSVTYGSSCGLNGIEYGEACDDGNSLNGDGCSADCLLEGSSSLYATPSFCGDGLTGTGELATCESGVTGDGKLDPIQVASVSNEAVFEVDPSTQQAVATIEVTEAESGLTTAATLSLLCAAETDQDCTDPAAYGVGTNNCCLERPTLTLFPNGEAVCQNAAVYAIFTEEMDLSSFEYEAAQNGATLGKPRMYARLDLSSTADGICPDDHTTLALEPRNPILKLWNKLVWLMTGNQVNAAPGDCVAPISSFGQTALGDGTYKVQMHLDALLVANGSYELVVEGDDDVTDGLTGGVTTDLGVGVNGSTFQGFTVGPEICSLDTVTVTDTYTESPYVFATGEEQHTFVATAESRSGGIPQAIDSIEGVYSWTWTNWETEQGTQIFAVEQSEVGSEIATVTAVGENGEDAVIATAAVEDNVTNLPTADTVTGSAPVLAFLCENPWPGDFSQLPWSDTADGDLGAEEGSGWMNFSTLYCRDQAEAGPQDDLPEVIVVRPLITESANVIKEYLFEVSGSSDAIGIRVVSNQDYLSPEAWYESQGFTGEVSQTEVDGYLAAQDGRTTYVVAPNQTATGDLYANVYALSYNAGASDDTINIYNQIVDNFAFAVNVDNVTMCVETEVACASPSEYLRRDTRRLTDLTDARSALIDYKTLNGVVPSLPSGTFVRSLTSSIWESWNSILGGALSTTLSADPINDYVACGGSGYEAYDAETCVNELTGTYVCPVNSHAYHYKAVGDTQAYLYADLEYATGTWVNPIEDDNLDGVTISIGNSSAAANGFEATAFCDGTSIYGLSTSCGDGVVGGAEVCELGQLGGSAAPCTTPEGLAGTSSQICNSSCDNYADDSSATCIVVTCGDGIIQINNEAGEDCDDGSLNGTYGFCGNDCSYYTAFYCGDGKLAGGEVCDCGLSVLMSFADSRAYGAGAGSCADVNGVYADSPNATCAWDCAGPAAYCGDGTIDSSETCDGVDATWDGKLCANTSPAGYANLPCTSDTDCNGGVCGGNGVGNRVACTLGSTRVMACDDDAGASCDYFESDWFDIECTEIGSCGDGAIDPGEECDDGNIEGTDSCTDQCKVNVCGDSYVYVGEEQCDEGLDNGTGCDSAYGSTCTACSLACRYEVTSGEFCGDGEINGGEYCDANSILPVWYDFATSTIDGTCTVLGQIQDSYTCESVGVCNGGGLENNGTSCLSSSECGTGTCVMPGCNQSCNSTCPFTYASVPLQMTTNQPGADASEVAEFFSYSEDLTSELPNAATLTVPACSVATSLTASVSLDEVELPTTYVLFVTDLSYTMQWEVGSNDLPEAGEDNRLEVAKDAIAAAAEELYDKLGDDVQIGAIGYRGLVGGTCFYHPETVCNVLGVNNDILCSSANFGDYCNDSSSSLEGTFFGPEPFDFVGPDGEDDLTAYTYALTFDPLSAGVDGHGTFTYEALLETKEMFDDIADSSLGDNARYIAILLSDGEVTDDSNYAAPDDDIVSLDPIEIAEDFDSYIPDTAGYELYTANLSNTGSWIENMKNWSSNSYNNADGTGEDSFATNEKEFETVPRAGTPRETSTFNGLDYAYNGDTDEEMAEMYDQIVDSIVEIAVTIVSENDGDVVQTTGFIEQGENVLLPWPDNFVCDDVFEQQVPIRISFPGIGMVEVSNVQLNYCAP